MSRSFYRIATVDGEGSVSLFKDRSGNLQIHTRGAVYDLKDVLRGSVSINMLGALNTLARAGLLPRLATETVGKAVAHILQGSKLTKAARHFLVTPDTVPHYEPNAGPPANRLPMHYAENSDGRLAYLVERPDGTFDVETRDERKPLRDIVGLPEIHVHIDLGAVVDDMVKIREQAREQARRLRKEQNYSSLATAPVPAADQGRKVLQEPGQPLVRRQRRPPGVPLGGDAQAEQPLYILRTGNNPLGKADEEHIYLKPGEEPPDNEWVHEGERGGHYYIPGQRDPSDKPSTPSKPSPFKRPEDAQNREFLALINRIVEGDISTGQLRYATQNMSEGALEDAIYTLGEYQEQLTATGSAGRYSAARDILGQELSERRRHKHEQLVLSVGLGDMPLGKFADIISSFTDLELDSLKGYVLPMQLQIMETRKAKKLLKDALRSVNWTIGSRERTYLHGTTEANLKAILKVGLLTNKTASNFGISKKGVVYLSPSTPVGRELSLTVGAAAAIMHNQRRFALLNVKTAASDIQTDPDAGFAGAVLTRKNVPAQAVTSYEIYDVKDFGELYTDAMAQRDKALAEGKKVGGLDWVRNFVDSFEGYVLDHGMPNPVREVDLSRRHKAAAGGMFVAPATVDTIRSLHQALDNIEKQGFTHEHDGYPRHPIGVKHHDEYFRDRGETADTAKPYAQPEGPSTGVAEPQQVSEHAEVELTRWWEDLNRKRHQHGAEPTDNMVISANDKGEAGELARLLWDEVHPLPATEEFAPGEGRVGHFKVRTRQVDTLRNVTIFEEVKDPGKGLTPKLRARLDERERRRRVEQDKVAQTHGLQPMFTPDGRHRLTDGRSIPPEDSRAPEGIGGTSGVSEKSTQKRDITGASPEVLKHPGHDDQSVHDPRSKASEAGKRVAIPKALRDAVLGDAPICAFCGTSKGPFHADHIVPVKVGGKNLKINLQPACRACNLARRAKDPSQKLDWIKYSQRQMREIMQQVLARPRVNHMLKMWGDTLYLSVPSPELEAMLRKHPGHDDQSVHGKKGSGTPKMPGPEWSPGRGMAYHVLPTHELASIRQRGVRPGSHSEGYKLPRVFVFTNPDEAEWYADMQADDAESEGITAPNGERIRMQVLPVDITGLPTMHDDTLRPNDEEETTALQVAYGIPSSRIRKHNTPRSPHRLHDPRVRAKEETRFKEQARREQEAAGQVERVDDEMHASFRALGLKRTTRVPVERGPLDRKAWRAIRHNIDAHISEHAAYMTQDTQKMTRRELSRQLGLFIRTGMAKDARLLDAYMDHATDALAYQELHAWRRQLGDHGIRHITEDQRLTDEMLRELGGTVGHVSSRERLLAAIALTYHDIGYTAKPARETFAGTKLHQVYSAQFVRQQPILQKLLGDDMNRVCDWIETHQDSDIDWAEDPVGSSIRLSDNLALFAREKLPALFRYVPGAVEELKAMAIDLQSGKADHVKRRKAKLRSMVEGARLAPGMKRNLMNAVDDIFQLTPKFTLGMLAGHTLQPKFDGQTMHIPIQYSAFAKTLQDLFQMGQEQFIKLGDSYGLKPADVDKGEFTFTNKHGIPVLHCKVVGAPSGVFKHLPDQHDQADHGSDGEGEKPKTPYHRWLHRDELDQATFEKPGFPDIRRGYKCDSDGRVQGAHTFYHGTSAESAAKILHEGLRDESWLAEEPSVSTHFARVQAKHHGGKRDRGVLFAVHVSSGAALDMDAANEAGIGFKTLGNISPDNIEVLGAVISVEGGRVYVELNEELNNQLSKHLPGEHRQEDHGTPAPPDPPKPLELLTNDEYHRWIRPWLQQAEDDAMKAAGATQEGSDKWYEIRDKFRPLERENYEKWRKAVEGRKLTPTPGVPLKPTPKYREAIRAWATAEEKKHGGVIGSPDGVVILSSPYRATDETDAMAEYMEKRSSRESMVRALSSQTSWNMGGGWAEWAAAAKIVGRELPKQSGGFYHRDEPELSDDDLKAYEARAEFIQARIRERYGDEIMVFRGLKGAFARKVKEAAVKVDEPGGGYHYEAELPVRELSSWTPSARTAGDFAYGYNRRGQQKHGKGCVVSMQMKTDDVFNSNEVGAKNVIRFTDDHDELVMLGREPTVTVKMERWEN